MTDELSQYLWTKRHELTCKLAVSYSYHRKRQRFFDLLDKGTKAMTVLVGASLLSEPIRNNLPLAAAAVSGLSLLSLVFAYGDRKQTHKEMAEAWMHLQARVDQVGPRLFTEAQLTDWAAEAARLDAREPPTLAALITICQNEVALATGNPASVHPLPWPRRLMANFKS